MNQDRCKPTADLISKRATTLASQPAPEKFRSENVSRTPLYIAFWWRCPTVQASTHRTHRGGRQRSKQKKTSSFDVTSRCRVSTVVPLRFFSRPCRDFSWRPLRSNPNASCARVGSSGRQRFDFCYFSPRFVHASKQDAPHRASTSHHPLRVPVACTRRRTRRTQLGG